MDLKYGVAWDDSLELGNILVDSQHHQLFELVSGLVAACMDGTDIIKLRETLDFLVNYTVCHFNDEEALQVKCGYPGYEEHRKMHDDFKITIKELAEKFSKQGASEELSKDVNKIVVRWLINHIQREDRRLADYIKKNAIYLAENNDQTEGMLLPETQCTGGIGFASE